MLSASEIEKMEELCEHMVIVSIRLRACYAVSGAYMSHQVTCMGPRHMKVVAEYVAGARSAYARVGGGTAIGADNSCDRALQA